MYLQFMLFCKYKSSCDKTYLDFFSSIPSVIFVAYVIVERPLSICCMTFAYLYNNCSIYIYIYIYILIII